MEDILPLSPPFAEIHCVTNYPAYSINPLSMLQHRLKKKAWIEIFNPFNFKYCYGTAGAVYGGWVDGRGCRAVGYICHLLPWAIQLQPPAILCDHILRPGMSYPEWFFSQEFVA